MTGKEKIATTDLIDAIPEARTEAFEKWSEHDTRIGCLGNDKIEIVSAEQGAGGVEMKLASNTDMNKL